MVCENRSFVLVPSVTYRLPPPPTSPYKTDWIRLYYCVARLWVGEATCYGPHTLLIIKELYFPKGSPYLNAATGLPEIPHNSTVGDPCGCRPSRGIEPLSGDPQSPILATVLRGPPKILCSALVIIFDFLAGTVRGSVA